MVFLKFALVAALFLMVPRISRWFAMRLRPDPAPLAATTEAVELPTAPGQTNLAGILEVIRAKYKIPCLAAAVLEGDQLVARGITGVRKAGSSERATLNDQFHLGSDTKAMTATLVAELIEEGKLDWSTTIGQIFGGSVKDMDPAWRTVTVEQLLTHRGGAPTNLNEGGLWSRLWERKGTPTEQRMELVKGVLSRPPAAAPGTKYIYSNAGYAIVGAMVEKITGRPWEELMQERLFKPLGITSGGFGAPGKGGAVDEPWGHTAVGTPVEPGPEADNPAAIGPAGTVHMTLADWSKFIALHLRGDSANPHRQVKLLKSATFDRLHRPADGPGPGYACGWLIAKRVWAKGSQPGDSGRVLTHAGSNTMWFCVV